MSKQADGEEFGPLLLIDTAGCDMEEGVTEGPEDSKANEGEARVALAHCQRLVAAGVPQKDIGIITPYSAQVVQLTRAKLLLSSPVSVIKHRLPVCFSVAALFEGASHPEMIVSLRTPKRKACLQVALLKEMRPVELDNLEIGTVDGFQGSFRLGSQRSCCPIALAGDCLLEKVCP